MKIISATYSAKINNFHKTPIHKNGKKRISGISPVFKSAFDYSKLELIEHYLKNDNIPENVVSLIVKALKERYHNNSGKMLVGIDLSIFRDLYKSNIKNVDQLVTDMLGGDIEQPILNIAAISLVKEKMDILQNDNCREFISSFLRNLKSGYINTRDVLEILNGHFDKFATIPEEYKKKKEEADRKYGTIYKTDSYYLNKYLSEMKDAADKITVNCTYENFADKNGNVSRESMLNAVKIAEIANDRTFIDLYLEANKNDKGEIVPKESGPFSVRYISPKDFEPHKSAQEIFDEYKEKNIFLAENFYNLLKELHKNDLLSCNDTKVFNEEFDTYGKLFLIIPDIPYTEKNKYEYYKIVNFLSSIKSPKFNLNMKDKYGITFLEKVLNSENELLLKFITELSDDLYTNDALVYNPSLDLVYDNINDKKFKEQVDNMLHIRFADLEGAIELHSKTVWDKAKNQLNSPLCKKEHVKDLFNLAVEKHNSYVCLQLVTNYSEYLSDYQIKQFDSFFDMKK